MAKRRVSRTKRARASPIRARFTRVKRRKGSSSGEKVGNIILYGAGYGAIRAPIAVMADSLLQKLPLPAQVADEAGMGILSYLAYKKGKGKLKALGKAGLYVESYRASDTFISPMVMGAVSGKMSGNTNSGLYIN